MRWVANLHYVRQGDPKGLGHAVLRAKRHVGDEAFAVLLGDDLIDEKEEPARSYGGGPGAHRRFCRCSDGGSPRGYFWLTAQLLLRLLRAKTVSLKSTGLVEKPAADEAPSNYAVIGRYVLSPKVFEVLENTLRAAGGEIQLTDALQTLAQGEGEGEGVYGVVFSGRRFDTGDKLSYLKANVILAAERPEFGDDLRAWLKDFVQRTANYSAPAL